MEVSDQLHAPAALPPGVGRWVGPRAGLDAVVREKFPSHAGTPSPIIYVNGRYVNRDGHVARMGKVHMLN
jgi:hypothetical protein